MSDNGRIDGFGEDDGDRLPFSIEDDVPDVDEDFEDDFSVESIREDTPSGFMGEEDTVKPFYKQLKIIIPLGVLVVGLLAFVGPYLDGFFFPKPGAQKQRVYVEKERDVSQNKFGLSVAENTGAAPSKTMPEKQQSTVGGQDLPLSSVLAEHNKVATPITQPPNLDEYKKLKNSQEELRGAIEQLTIAVGDLKKQVLSISPSVREIERRVVKLEKNAVRVAKQHQKTPKQVSLKKTEKKLNVAAYKLQAVLPNQVYLVYKNETHVLAQGDILPGDVAIKVTGIDVKNFEVHTTGGKLTF